MRSRGDGLGRVAVFMGLVVLAASLVAVSDAGAQDDLQPSGSSFSDVEGHWAADYISALDDLGVLEGTECGEAMLCPDAPLKRETMAVWLVRVLDGSDPEPVEGTRFFDVDGSHRWAAHIERFAELGVTDGYGDGTYRPDVTVSRAQMAAFLARAFELPAAEPAGFGDIEGDFHEDNINRVAAVGITTGCGDGTNYCPNRQTSRAQMAVFIGRALDYVDSLESGSGLARAAAMEIFSVVYSSASPFSAVAPHLEDAAALEAVHAQFAAFGANVGGVEITATGATAAADRTDRVIVTFEVRVAGVSIPITGRDTSSVWLVDGTWIVSRGAFCNAMAQLEIICPPVGEPVESGWVEPYAGYVPPVHPDTPQLQGELGPEPGDWGTRPADEPRATGDDRRMVAAWIAWAGPTEYAQWLMFQMKWALDYLGAAPQCVINEYYDRAAAAGRASAPGAAEPYELRDLHGWHNCATVIDPYLVGVELPAGRDNDVGLRLSDTPGITLAERCRAVLPPDVQLEKSWYQQRGPDGDSIFAPPPPKYGYLFEAGHAGCDAWAAWFTPSPSSPTTRRFYPVCSAASRLAEEWMEHYRGLPVHYHTPTC